MSAGKTTRVLLVEDGVEGNGSSEIREVLSTGSDSLYSVECVGTLGAAKTRLGQGGIDVVILNPDSVGMRGLVTIRERAAQVPVVVLLSEPNEDTAARLMREGAQDCLVKGQFDRSVLVRTIRHALERAFAEQALRESEQRFRRVFEEGTLGMALVGVDFRVAGVNNAFCRTLGYAKEDILGGNFSTITHPDDADADEQLADALRGDGHCRQLEKRYVKSDGSVLWGNQSASVVRDEKGTPLYGIVMVEDITERRKAEEAVRRSLNLLHAVVGGTTDAVYVKDRGGKYLLLNSVAAKQVGQPASEIVGKGDDELYDPEVAQEIIESDRRIMASGQTQTFEETLTVAGIAKTYLSTKGVYRDDAGNVAGMFGIARDITDRTRAEEELRRSEAKYRELVEHATYGIYRSTVEGHFLSANPALARMLGYDSEKSLLAADKDADLHWGAGERQRFLEICRRDQLIDGLEVEWRRNDGERILVRLSGHSVRTGDGEIEGFEVIAEDITERRILEGTLHQAQKMQALGELTGGIAHDLNNILTVVSTNLELISASLPADEQELGDDVRETTRAVRRGSMLIRKLLGFSRRSHLELKPINVVRLVTDLSTMVRRVVPENIRIYLETDPKAGTIRADTGALEQMLLNLVTNARDAMDGGGHLRILVRRQELDEEYNLAHPWTAPGEYVCISVSDTGIGMDLETRERIFEPFFTTKPPELGTGLGLSMVYGLVKQQGGSIEVYTEPGQGTTVKLYFPLVPETAVRERDTAPRTMIGGTETILIVEDEEPIRRAARRVLEKHGYTVLLASDGEEALKLYPKHQDEIDLVISDVVMPRLGGVKFYEALREQGGAPKILFTSGYTKSDVQNSGSLDPGMPFLHKPWTVADLLEKIREVLDDK
jgi:two-component system cell cycle sensor histidine kinase/response regulator CckA